MSKEVQKWADSAMFRAEPLDASKGPQVYLLWMTPDPLGAVAAACKMYKGEVVRSLSDVTDAERIECFQQIQRTKLKAPFEFVKFHFMIEGVTRSLTHQMVRQRTAVYAQESLRFAVKEDLNESVAIPPSLAGSSIAKLERDMNELDLMRADWEIAVKHIESAYASLIERGMPAEDARGLLPHNVTTRLHYSTDLRALLDHAGNRLCTQAQFEWRALFARIIESIRGKNIVDALGNEFYSPPAANEANGTTHIYMADKLTSLFKPVCFQTGKCEFKANFDRKCKIRERVDAFEKAGVNPEEWEIGRSLAIDRPAIHGIKPYEWLADPDAAR